MLRFLGVIMFILIVVGFALPMNGHTWVAWTFGIGCGAILVGLIVMAICRH